MKPKVYFGHPISFYDVPRETALITAIQKRFPHFEVENPNQIQHQEGYQRYTALPGKRGMDYFFEEVLPAMAAGVFLSFEDGTFGAGVVGEAEFLDNQGKPIYEIDIEGRIAEMLLDPIRNLSVEQTRSRVYDKDRKIIKYLK